MATQRQCATGCSPFTQPLHKPLPLLTFLQLTSLLFFPFLSLLSPAHSHSTEPSSSSYSSLALRSSHIHPLQEHDEPYISKPFIYETVAASISPPSSLSMHALHDAQDHASKEEAPIANPAFIYESIAASFSLRSRAEGSQLLDNSLPQDADTALILDDGGKHVSFVAKPSFIYEPVAASLPQKAHGISTLVRESASQEENAFLLDDGIGKPIMKKEVAKPSFVYESVITTSIPSSPPSDSSILRDNVPREENAFLLDDGAINPIMQKRVDPVTAKPSFIYESVAASIHSDVRDFIRNNVPQEENAFLLDDGGKHVDRLEKEAKPITGKPFIYESVAAQFHNSAVRRAAGGSRVHDNVSQEENSSLLADDGKHVHNGLKKEEPIKAKLYSLENEPMAASSHPRSTPGGSVLRENVPQLDNVLLLDNGGKHVHETPAAAVASTQDKGKLLQENVPQEKYTFLHDDGRQEPISSAQHDGNNKVLLIDTKPLHDIDVKKSFNVQENKSPAKAPPASLLRDNVPQGKHAFLVGDGGVKHVEHESPVASSKEVDVLLHDIVPQEKHGSLVDDGGKHNSRPNEENLRIVVAGDSTSRSRRPRDEEIGVGVEGNPPIVEGSEVKGFSAKEERLRMVVGDSSNNMIQRGYKKVQGINPSNAENLRMVVGDSSKSMIQEEGYGNPPPKSKNNLRMVVDDTSINTIMKARPFGTRSRSRSCSSLPDVCHQLAHAEHMNHILLYGLPPGPTPDSKNPACCGGACVDLNNNDLNCGRCGQACGLSQTCCNGNCTDLNKDDLNCGQCGHPCPLLSPCQYGMCGYY